jgi:hypothetical protein
MPNAKTESSTYLPILIPSTLTLNNMDPWAKISLFPSQLQLEKSLNQKTKQPLHRMMGWDSYADTHPHKEIKIQTASRFSSGKRKF